jgi:hypothetical protein
LEGIESIQRIIMDIVVKKVLSKFGELSLTARSTSQLQSEEANFKIVRVKASC